ncbi:unnamed protein product [Symbiodinium sp. CCMP2592]|nr:unnamed protein product [Symbiodinium sp. CCMP2592]
MVQRMRTLSQENLNQYELWLHCLKVEEMSASNPADTELILSKIEDKARFNEELQSLIFGKDGLISACHMGFERMAILGAVARQGAIRLKQASSSDVASASSDSGSPSAGFTSVGG